MDALASMEASMTGALPCGGAPAMDVSPFSFQKNSVSLIKCWFNATSIMGSGMVVVIIQVWWWYYDDDNIESSTTVVVRRKGKGKWGRRGREKRNGGRIV